MAVKSRQQKSRIVTTIVDGIKRSAGKEGGGFVRKVRSSVASTVHVLMWGKCSKISLSYYT
jgi:hypothetical protein